MLPSSCATTPGSTGIASTISRSTPGLQHGVVLAPFVLDEARLALLRSRERRIAAVLDTEGISL
jgi:hypothetical protein